MEPRELTDKATGKTVGYFCGKCLHVSALMLIGGHVGEKDERVAAARQAAAEHCGPWFCACGAEAKRPGAECDRCRGQRQTEEADAKERAALEKAEKVAAKDWTGEYVWSDRFEEIFSDIDELLGRYEEEGEEPPEYVWECEPEKLKLDAEDILEAQLDCQEAPDGAADHLTTDDRTELQALLDGWLEKRSVKWWWKAYRRAVLLREETSDG